jgi:hypothetical protein
MAAMRGRMKRFSRERMGFDRLRSSNSTLAWSVCDELETPELGDP